MAKIYDALRRAELERQKQESGPAAAPALGFERVESSAAVEAPTRRKRRWFRRRMKAEADSLSAANKRRIALLQPNSFVTEQYRALRVRIDAIAGEQPLRSIVVMSAMPGEGKTTSAINLAAVMSLSLDRRVLLVDCDLRQPRIHLALGLRPEAGLTEVLNGQANLDRAIQKVEGANFDALGVRARPANPSELLGSARMREVIEELCRRYDRVIFDSPPALGLPDARALSELCDGLILVVRAGMTAQRDVEAALEFLDRRRILGLLLNGATLDQKRHGYAQ